MATISQLPGALTLNAVAGNPASLQFNVTITDSDGNPIDWSNVSDWAILVTDQYGNTISGAIPAVISPSANVIEASWTPDQTSLLGQTLQARMALSLFVYGNGPYTLASGPIVMTPPTYPGQA
jgi:hypothetical protein